MCVCWAVWSANYFLNVVYGCVWVSVCYYLCVFSFVGVHFCVLCVFLSEFFCGVSCVSVCVAVERELYMCVLLCVRDLCVV